MKKTICGKIYDTDEATLVYKHTYGAYGEPSGYEETLYQTPAGLFFLYVNGGETSEHPNEDIIRMSKAKAADWQKAHA